MISDDRAITGLSADLTWQPASVVISPMVMSVGRDFVLTSEALREDLAACTDVAALDDQRPHPPDRRTGNHSRSGFLICGIPVYPAAE